MGCEHLLLGVLATHEVAHAHPYMLPADADRLYLGGRVLAEFGATYRRAKDLLASLGGGVGRGGSSTPRVGRRSLRLTRRPGTS